MKKKMKKNTFLKSPPLLVKIAIAIILGSLLGNFMQSLPFLMRVSNTLSGFFDQFIRFMVPLIIVGLVTPAIAETGERAGKMLLTTVGIAYLSTFLAGTYAFSISSNIFPHLIAPNSMQAISVNAASFPALVDIRIPAIFDVTSALALSFVLGLGMVFSKSEHLKQVSIDFKNVITKIIASGIVPLLPFYIFGMFLDMSATGKIKPILLAFAAIVLIDFVLTIILIIIQYIVAGIISGRNPFKALIKMMPAYFTALGTASSAATIPVTRNQAIAAGVRQEVADFTVPLCATVHLAGSTLKIVDCSVALLIASGSLTSVNFATFIPFILMLGIVMVAAPGVPGGAVMASLAVAESQLGFGKEQIALLISLYIATDSFGTACNVTGDGAISLIINKIFPSSKKGDETNIA